MFHPLARTRILQALFDVPWPSRILAPCLVWLLASTATGQLNDLTTVPLTPPLPNYFGSSPPAADPLGNYRLTTGDLNGDGVPDLVFSNAVAFLRVYYLQKDVNGVPYVNTYQDLMPYVPNSSQCNSTGDGARFLSTSPYFLDEPVIYDINLDGLNDLIYLKHFANSGNKGEVRLQVYTWNGTRLKADTHASDVTLNLLPLLQTTGGHGYFSSSCAAHDKAPGECFYMRIVNLRGRAFPQDILVWTANPPYDPNVRVYAYDTNGGTPTLTLLIQHHTKNSYDPVSQWRWEGLCGHTWSSLDIDADGKDELIGKQTLAYDPSVNPEHFRLLGGVNLKRDFNVQSTPSQADDPHPDYVTGTDLLRNYRDEAGNLIPSPGVEMLVAPHTHLGVTPDTCDPSGPWIYRAITGHQEPLSGPVAWPRKLLNIVSGLNTGHAGSGDNYWFASSTANGWRQPTSSSHWNDLGNAFSASFPISDKRPDPQVAFPCDLIYDPVNGLDQQPGPEIVCLDKLGDFSGGCGLGENHYIFSSGDALTALGWGENDAYNVNGPTILGTFPLDMQGNRDQVELHSIVQFCPSAIQPASHVILSWHRINANGSPDPSGRTFAPSVLYSRHANTTVPNNDVLGAMDGTTAYDLMGDRREELLFWRNFNPQGAPQYAFTQSEVVVVRDPSTPNFTEPPPQKFLDYRLSLHDTQFTDYKSFSGLRFRTKYLMPGKANAVYGVAQDKKVVGTLSTEKQTGFTILAEGGTGPYSFALTQGVLPVGLATQSLSLSSGFPAGAFLLYGTPIEVTTKRLELTVTDSSVPPQSRTQSFWITVKSGGGFSLVDSVPKIVAGGFSDAYLVAGSPQTLPVTADVTDSDDNVVSVKLYDKFGVEQSSLTHTIGTNTWTGTFTASLPVVGRDTWYTMRATDSAGNVSVSWPYLVVNGGPGATANFLDEAFVVQPPNLTPFITKVGMPAHTIPAAEISDGQGTQSLTVAVDRRGMTVTKIEARIVHSLPGVDSHRYQKILTPPNGTLDLYSLTFDTLPSGEFGWGDYTVNVQVTVQAAGGATYVSDWWPQVTAH